MFVASNGGRTGERKRGERAAGPHFPLSPQGALIRVRPPKPFPMSDHSSKKPLPADDDRNLVLVDSDFSDADLDDRAWLLWERRKKIILLSAGVIFAAGMAFISWRSLSASKAEALGAEYNAISDPALKLAFAERHAGEPLAAFAALESADAAYAKGDYAEAASRYGRTVALASSVRPRVAAVLARARIGAAVSEIRAGRADEGLKLLGEIADTLSNPAALRAHALFLLAEHACGEKKFDRARNFLNRIDLEASGSAEWTLPSSSVRMNPKSLLIDSFPELKTEAAAPAPAAK